MTDRDQQRNYIRRENACQMNYKFLDSEQSYQGRCTSLSGSGIFFTTNQAITPGKALAIHIPSQSPLVPDMMAFIEVLRSTLLSDQLFEIDGTIKSIKATHLVESIAS